MAQEFLGIGWKFPVKNDNEGNLVTSEYEQNIRESILIILGTAKGERQMRPDFGCGIHELVFAANNTATAGMAVYHVQQALIRWEPRIELIRVHATPRGESAPSGPQRGTVLLVNLEYRVIATNSIFNLVYPFYLTEGIGV